MGVGFFKPLIDSALASGQKGHGVQLSPLPDSSSLHPVPHVS